ncbi:hypothetical protein EYF80_009247 [Liparis tanakae]|uniref:Uncharacterized protein n=1 Tax=Liparis tanakae TaxID=230148 RepID=A0A4Z2ISC9_9TELE|nr:hypothetical protein EYF80_009247 [Liparis tanakae]
MALTVMTLCYSKHKALRQSTRLLWRLQQGSTRGKGIARRETERRAAGGEGGGAAGVKGNNVSGTQAGRQVSTATGKRRRLPMCLRLLHPTTPHPTPLHCRQAYVG